MALVDPTLECGVPGGAELLAFADAVVGSDGQRLDRVRTNLASTLGPAAISAASAIAATFSMNDRIANATGIPVIPMVLKATKDIRDQLGLNAFRSAQNTFKHFQDV